MKAICDVCGKEIEEGESYTCKGCSVTCCPECLADVEEERCFDCVDDATK